MQCKCGTENVGGAVSCVGCDARLCLFCASNIRLDDTLCPSCGRPNPATRRAAPDPTIIGVPLGARATGAAEPGPYRSDGRLDSSSIQTGAILGGRYRVEREIGRGGMGVVYLAHDASIDLDVAVKVLPKELARDQRAIREMKREARLAMQLSHPHIVRLHNFEEADGVAFLVMEFVHGETLAERLSREETLPAEQATALVIEMCDALEYAHRKGVVHRDIKPANVMLETSGLAKLADFGIARAIHDAATRLTRATTSGTLAYMAPEVLLGQPATGQSDLYALGVLFHELLTGRPPFVSGDVTYQQINVRPARLSGVPDYVADSVEKCLAKNSSERWQDAADIAEALRRREASTPRVASALITPRAGEKREAVHATKDSGKAIVELVEVPARRFSPRNLIFGGAAAAVVVGLVVWLAVSGRPHAGPADVSPNSPDSGGPVNIIVDPHLPPPPPPPRPEVGVQGTKDGPAMGGAGRGGDQTPDGPTSGSGGDTGTNQQPPPPPKEPPPEPPPPAVATAIVTLDLLHDHGGAMGGVAEPFRAHCNGTLRLLADRLMFDSPANDGFDVEYSRIKEVKTNSRFNWGQFNAFHIRLSDGRNLNFVLANNGYPGELIDQLVGAAAGRAPHALSSSAGNQAMALVARTAGAAVDSPIVAGAGRAPVSGDIGVTRQNGIWRITLDNVVVAESRREIADAVAQGNMFAVTADAGPSQIALLFHVALSAMVTDRRVIYDARVRPLENDDLILIDSRTNRRYMPFLWEGGDLAIPKPAWAGFFVPRGQGSYVFRVHRAAAGGSAMDFAVSVR